MEKRLIKFIGGGDRRITSHNKGFNLFGSGAIVSVNESLSSPSLIREGWDGYQSNDKKQDDTPKVSRKAAFTLAEVLITLGIIGVVAALTIPTLIANYRNQVYVNQLKKSVSTIEQGFKKALVDDEVDDLNDTEMYGYLKKNLDYEYATFTSFDDPRVSGFINYLKKYFNIVDYTGVVKYPIGSLSPSGYSESSFGSSLTFADGSILLINYVRCGSSNDAGYFFLDVNGKKGPNRFGKDIYVFYLGSNGLLIPNGSKKSTYAGYWKDTKDCGEEGKKAKNVSGMSCAARIIENGWKIDYL